MAEVLARSSATIKRWLKRCRETGDIEAKPVPGRPTVKGSALRAWLPGQLENNPALTLKEHCEALEEEHGVKVATAGEKTLQ